MKEKSKIIAVGSLTLLCILILLIQILALREAHFLINILPTAGLVVLLFMLKVIVSAYRNIS